MYPFRIVAIEECDRADEALACLDEYARSYATVRAECLEGDEDGGTDWVELTRDELMACARQEAELEREFGHLVPWSPRD